VVHTLQIIRKTRIICKWGREDLYDHQSFIGITTHHLHSNKLYVTVHYYVTNGGKKILIAAHFIFCKPVNSPLMYLQISYIIKPLHLGNADKIKLDIRYKEKQIMVDFTGTTSGMALSKKMILEEF
jgi:hypothetical protein